MSEGKVSERWEGLDALRAILLIGGVFVHSSLISQEAPYLIIRYLSSMFRMETFILLGGFLSVFSATRRGSGWMKRRVFILLIPFIFGSLVLNPINILVIQEILLYNPEHPSFSRLIEGSWHLHLWFLPVLAALAPLTPAICGLWKRYSFAALGPLSKVITHRWSALLVFGSLWTACFGFLIAASLMRWSSFIPGSVEFIVWSIIHYAPYYMIGSVMALHRPLFEFMCRLHIPLVLTGSAVLLYGIAARIGGAPELWPPMSKTLDILASLAFINFLLFVFTNIRSISYRTKDVVESSYTMYIVHYILVTIGILIVGELAAPTILLYLSLVCSVIIISYLFHFFVVRKSNIAKLFFNGEWLDGSRATEPPAGTGLNP